MVQKKRKRLSRAATGSTEPQDSREEGDPLVAPAAPTAEIAVTNGHGKRGGSLLDDDAGPSADTPIPNRHGADFPTTPVTIRVSHHDDVTPGPTEDGRPSHGQAWHGEECVDKESLTPKVVECTTRGSLLRPHPSNIEETSIPRSSVASSETRRSSSRTPAQNNWQRCSKRVNLASKMISAFKPQESKYFGWGRVLGRIVADNCLFWPYGDVRCTLVDTPFTSYTKMLNWKLSLYISPLHFIEDVVENFVEERDEVEGREGDSTRKAKTEACTTLLSFGIFHLRQRLILGLSPFSSPLSFFNGAFARFLSVAPFLGGYGSLVPTYVQTAWLVVMFKPLNVVSFFCTRKNMNEIAAVKQIYKDSGLRGFFNGVSADMQICGSMLLAHLLSDLEIRNAYLGAGLALCGALWKKGPRLVSEASFLCGTAVATSLLKNAVSYAFGDPPIRACMEDVQHTRDFIQTKTIANSMVTRLVKRAEEEAFHPEIMLEKKEPLASSLVDEEENGFPRQFTMATVARSMSTLLVRATTRTFKNQYAVVYLSGLRGQLYALNGRYDAETDADGNIVTKYSRPKYRRYVPVESEARSDGTKTSDFDFWCLRYTVSGEIRKWTLIDQDRTSVLGFCDDHNIYPFHATQPWVVLTDNGDYEEDHDVKVSCEPTLFLHRMNVFSVLNQMLQADHQAEDEIDRAVNPTDEFCLQIRRSSLAKSSLQAILGGLPSDLVAHDFSVMFKGESGLDYGGLRREWFSLLAEELSKIDDLEMQLWDTKIDREGKWFNTLPDQSLLPCEGAPVQFYIAIGRLLAMSLIHCCFCPMPLSFVIFKYILEIPITGEDLKALDPDFYKHRFVTLLTPGGSDKVAEMLGERLTFVSAASPGTMGGKPLCPNGESVEVTEDNKMEYAHLLAEEYLCGNITQQLHALVSGFWDLCPKKALTWLTAKDLRALTIGPDEAFDFDVLRQSAKYEGSEENKIQFEWFLQAVASLSIEESVRFLQFFTGASRMPQEGLRPPFTLVINEAWDIEQLPTAHTCANTVCIPAYSSYELLYQKLRTALEFHTGFGFD
eukprot:GEMP01005025.1.p1 GENE.GEMP01005025.1~~GEMP01005025.1.p1  ORF type:complete len:1057 (+),score=185.49 GEMP01005025.1:114-3284(+)